LFGTVHNIYQSIAPLHNIRQVNDRESTHLIELRCLLFIDT